MNTPRIRVLHVVGAMNRGGVETWLLHVARTIDRDRFQIDFLVHTDQPCAYDAELRGLGCRILPCLGPNQPLRYGRAFRRLLRDEPPYDVLHSHVHHFSGLLVRQARKMGIPVRIAHSHNDTRAQDGQGRLPRRLYLGLMRHWIARHATGRVAASREAGVALFGGDPGRSWRVLYCGVDLTPFAPLPERTAIRAELGLPPDALVLGHVGRFMEQKNHAFLVRIAAEVFRSDPRARLLLIGEGPLRSDVERQVQELGIADRVHLLGSRPDVPRLLAATDVFVLPSLYEGLPLVGMEVQAAGVPLVLTETITPEVDIVPGLVHRLPLDHSPATWAERVLAAARARAVAPAEALEAVRRSPFNIRHGVHELEQYYAESLVHA